MLSLIQTVFRQIAVPAALFLLLAASAAYSKEIGIVTASRLNVRSGPDRLRVVTEILKKGAQVTVLEKKNGWLKISLNGKTGYVRDRKKYIRIIETKTKKPGLLSKDNQKAGSETEKIEKIEAEVKDIGKQIEHHKAKIEKYRKEETSILNRLDEIELKLNNTRKRVSSLENEIAIVRSKTKKTETGRRKLVKKIDDIDLYATKRLVALYKLNLLGKIHFLASADSMYDFVSRKTAMEKILAHDENVLEEYLKSNTELKKVLARLKARNKEKLSLEKKLKNQINIMSRDKKKRERVLTDIRTKKSLGMAAIVSLKRAADELDRTVTALRKKSENANETSGENFSQYKGLLEMPVKGKIISLFGPYNNTRFNVVNFRSGIEIAAKRGTTIQTVYSGKVLYANWFKGYGNMMIIDHGSNYYTVYAHADSLLKKTGDLVTKSEAIATVGDTSSLTGSNLYFEIRHYGKPINPLKWLKKS